MNNRILRAKLEIVKRFPELSRLLCLFPIEENNEIRTFAVSFTDGKVFYNKSFLDSLQDNEVVGVLLHEYSHVIREPIDTISGDMALTIAEELKINDWIDEQGFALPKTDQRDGSEFFVPRYHAWKDISNINEKSTFELADELRKKGMKKTKKFRMIGERIGSPKDLPPDHKIILDCVKSSVRGTSRSSLSEIMEVKPEELDIKNILFPYIRRVRKATYLKPNRRQPDSPLPGSRLIKSKDCEVIISIDTSGSMSDKLRKVIGQAISLIRQQDIRGRLIQVDADIQSDADISSIRNVNKLEVRGYGGTDHRPLYEYIAKKYPSVRLIINFTDLETAFPDRPIVKAESIWITNSSLKAPFGKTYRVEW